ncbi:MAG: acyl transferase [Bacteroidetes bacterium]|nr:acyl transferase [Bacteroidota bacterium]
MPVPFSKEEIFSVKKQNFNELALEIFQFQARENEVYNRFIRYTTRKPEKINRVEDIPFLPVEIYKNHIVNSTGEPVSDLYFASSATTGQKSSRHYLFDRDWYELAFRSGFEKFYGDPESWNILALLPGYIENPHSSLISMVRILGAGDNDFYLSDFDALFQNLENRTQGKYLLIGVSHALVDFAERFQLSSGDNLVIMETGGMKGRKKEITREELHRQLMSSFGVQEIHSEYGMAELFSQAYSSGGGYFSTPPWMKVFIRSADDPFSMEPPNIRGGICVADLANVETCSFVATSDIGRMLPDNTFEVLGRFDHSEVRGCNVMIA